MANAIRNRRTWQRVFLALAVAILLSPAIAMQFSDEVAWGIEDFAGAGAILSVAWVAFEIVLRTITGKLIKAGALTAVTAMLVLTCAHLAVGLF
jgi:hypothetical protein